MILVGTQNQAFFPENILEKFNYIKEMGFDTYEMDGQLLVEHLAEVKQAIQATGVKVLTVCNGYSGWIGDFNEEKRQQAIADISEILKALGEIGGKGIVVPAAWGMFTYRLPPMEAPRSKEEDFAAVADSLIKLNKVAKETNTYLYLEPLNRYQDHMVNTVADAARYITELELDHVRIIADFYHMNIEEDDLSKTLIAYKNLIHHIHLADNHRFQPGSGSLDFKKHFDTLKKIGYEGQVVYECRLRGEDEPKVYQESLEFIRKALED